MIKLKNILSEGYAWERQAGKPLPTMKDVQEKYQRNLQEQDPGTELDIVAGNPGKEVPVKSDALQIYDIDGNLVPKQYIPAGLEKRVQTTPDVKLHAKYYFATRPGKLVTGTSLAVYDRVTGELRDNDTKELLITLQKDMPARQIYLWLRRNHWGKRDVKFKRNVKFEAYDAKGVEDAVEEGAEGAKPDYIDADGDGDEKESMKKAFADKKAGKKVNEEETEEESDHAADEEAADMDVLNMGSLEEGFWNRVKGNLHGHEYILREAFRK